MLLAEYKQKFYKNKKEYNVKEDAQRKINNQPSKIVLVA